MSLDEVYEDPKYQGKGLLGLATDRETLIEELAVTYGTKQLESLYADPLPAWPGAKAVSDSMTKHALAVGPDTPTVTNDRGAKQSAMTYRLDLMPPLALLAVGKVLKDGSTKYGIDNWHGISLADHLNHALVHVYAYLAGDTQDDHLEHAACRMLMAVENVLAKHTPVE